MKFSEKNTIKTTKLIRKTHFICIDSDDNEEKSKLSS